MLSKFHKYYITMLVLLCILLAISLSGCGDTLEYDQGKDSHAAFGNGEYQLLWYTSISGERRLCLNNCRINTAVLYDVKQYIVDDEYGYFLGSFPMNDSRSFPLYALLHVNDNHIKLIYYQKDSELINDLNQLSSQIDASGLLDIQCMDHIDGTIKRKLLALNEGT